MKLILFRSKAGLTREKAKPLMRSRLMFNRFFSTYMLTYIKLPKRYYRK